MIVAVATMTVGLALAIRVVGGMNKQIAVPVVDSAAIIIAVAVVKPVGGSVATLEGYEITTTKMMMVMVMMVIAIAIVWVAAAAMRLAT
jgi:hypothetical protein